MTGTANLPQHAALAGLPPLASLKIAYAQMAQVAAARGFISNMTRMLTGQIPAELLASLTETAEAMLTDFAIDGPADLFTASASCVAPLVPFVDDEDAANIDAIYGDGFTARLLRLCGAPAGSRWEPDPLSILFRRVEEIAKDVAAISETVHQLAHGEVTYTVS